MNDENEDLDDLPVLTDHAEEYLNPRQVVDYKHHRKRLLKWMLNIGKDPDKGEGYSYHTVRARANHLDNFFRWVWEEHDGYTTRITKEQADDFARDLAYSDESYSHKTNLVKSIKMYFRWRRFETGKQIHWESPISFSGSEGKVTPKDFLTREERELIREAALEYGTVPHYNAISPDERKEWTRHLARRFKKPMRDISKEDFERANGFKVPSLVWTSLDTGLRPIEVKRAKLNWVDPDNAILRIPADEAAKNSEDWQVSVKTKTADFLDLWMDERRLYEKYDGTDRLWLNREGNPYESHSLKYLLRKLCEIAGIPIKDRQMTWYTIRHSVGTYMAREEGLAAARAQLRHKSVETTMRYDQAPPEDRRDALDRMG